MILMTGDLERLVLVEDMTVEVLLGIVQGHTEKDLDVQVLLEVGLWVAQVQIEDVMEGLILI